MGKVPAELRQTIRSLRRSPGFTAVAIVSLGLSLGATTAVFSMINAVAFRPLPYPQPERLVEVSEHHPVEVCEGCGVGTSYPAFLDLRELDVFERSAVSVESTFAWGDRTPEGESVPVYGASVSSDFFGVLGEQPVRGRSFAADDARPGAPPVVVISEQFWRARLGAAEVLGVDFEINGVSHVVVGIVAADFAFPSGARLWVPIRDGAAPRGDGQNASSASWRDCGRGSPWKPRTPPYAASAKDSRSATPGPMAVGKCTPRRCWMIWLARCSTTT